MIKIICCDVDGTLVTDDKKITALNKQWIKKAVNEKGIKFVIVSGRLLPAIRGFYDELEIKGPASAFNGCALYDENDKICVDHRIENEIALKILHAARSCNQDLIFFDGQDWIMENKDSFTYREKLKLYKKDCKIASFDKLMSEMKPNKLLTMFESENQRKKYLEALTLSGINESNITYYMSSNFVELMPYGVSKANAIEDLASYYHVDKSEIMAIGDDYNDIGMLKVAGISVVMGNAPDEIKKLGSFVTASNQESGVAKAIEKLVF